MIKEKTSLPSELVDPITQYLDDIGSIPRITHEQEIMLGRRVQKGLAATHELETNQALSTDRKNYLERTALIGSDAQDYLFRANLQLVVSVAKLYTDRNVPFLDLIQEGNLGLKEAAEKYDPERGTVFSTYAVWLIRKKITLAIPELDRPIPISKSQHDLNREIRRAKNQIYEEKHRIANYEEIAAIVSVKMKRKKIQVTTIIKNILDFQPQRSLHSQVSNQDGDDGDELMDVISDKENSNPLSLLLHEEQLALLADALTHLTPIQTEIISRRILYTGKKKPTQEQVAKDLSLQRNQVARIEQETLLQLRDILSDKLKIGKKLEIPSIASKPDKITHTSIANPAVVRTKLYTTFCTQDLLIKFSALLRHAKEEKSITEEDYQYLYLFLGLDDGPLLSTDKIAQRFNIGYSKAHKNLVFALTAAHRMLSTTHAADPDIAQFLTAITKNGHTPTSLQFDP